MADNELDLQGLKEALAGLLDRIEGMEDRGGLKQKAMRIEKDTERMIGEKPFQAIGVAFGLGLVAGMMVTAMARK